MNRRFAHEWLANTLVSVVTRELPFASGSTRKLMAAIMDGVMFVLITSS